ncbi:MAG: cysteine--1-D-myo-inosityl 2-amino-2-deoxy-alpha-D-glucopyranoside ligase, partial [Nocardioidaceae bacterium]|nr:cysteine--1-D-myo-inosityl 2-amino-2-deoxy-alpha-D-glucopyranoside ligase [Nocardioidaceae bacterium]
EGRDPMAVRLALLAHHYRSDWEWTDADLAAAEERLASWRRVARTVSRERAEALVGEVRAALAADLDAPAALTAVDALAALEDHDPGDGSGEDLFRRLLDARLGLLVAG